MAERLVHFVIDCPWPTLSGGDIRNAMIADAFAGSDYLCIGLTEPSAALDVRYHQIRAFRGRNPWRMIDPRTPTAIAFPAESLEEASHVVNKFRPTLAIFEGVAWRDVLSTVAGGALATVLDMHNIESHLHELSLRQRPAVRRWLSTFTSRHRLRACRTLDAALSRRATQTWVCSEQDCVRLADLGGTSHRVIPNPIPNESVFDIPIRTERYRHATPIFVGHLAYFPNVMAVRELAERVGPRLRDRGHPVRPFVAGRSPNRLIKRFADEKAIELVPDPPSCLGFLANHGYSLMPIRHGSGTRIKALEALAAGLVIIAYPQAIEGLGLVAGVHYLPAAHAEEMVSQLLGLVSDPSRGAAMAEAGRELARAKYARVAIHREIRSAIRSSVDR